MESYTTIKDRGIFEYEDRKSVFIGEAMPVKTEEDALAFIAHIKKKYTDARHHVYAYVLRDNSIMRYSDDREPQGTAGMPTLDAIRKRGCTDTVVVVTRYFGGTLLGTGGLVRAYSAAAVGAIGAAGLITFENYTLLKISVSYSDFQKLSTVFDECGFRTEDTSYTDSVTIEGKILSAELEKLIKLLNEATSMRAKIENLGEKFDF